MTGMRTIARRLLAAMVQHSSAESRNWADAMLREMDFVESDWPALRWALGSTTVLCRLAVSRRIRMCFPQARSLKEMAKQLPAMLAGVAVAGAVLTVCVLLLSSLSHAAWFRPALWRLADRTLVVIVPEAVYLAGAAVLWRRRRSVAAGMLAAGLILMTHAIVHFATHGHQHSIIRQPSSVSLQNGGCVEARSKVD